MRRNQIGFTLIELMIVVAIIGLLAALAIPNFIRFQARSRQSEAKSNLKAMFTAEKAYYGDKQVYCSAGDLVGFEPERNNRYAYWLSAGPSATEVRPAATPTVTITPAAPTSCGSQTANINYEAVSEDRFKGYTLPAATPPVGNVGGTYAAVGTNVAVAVAPANVGVQSAAGACQAGQCEWVGAAVGNIDNDTTLDEWFISTVSGNSTAYGNFGGGEPVNQLNDVSN